MSADDVRDRLGDVNTSGHHRDWGAGMVIGGDADGVTVLLDQFGYRVLSMSAVNQNDLLPIR